MTTGMSAPPMDAVMCAPSAPDMAVVVASAPMPCNNREGEGGRDGVEVWWAAASSTLSVPTAGDPVVRNAAPDRREAVPMVMFIWSRMGNLSGAESNIPFSFPKATIDPARTYHAILCDRVRRRCTRQPVAVIPPMKVAR
jgi:hypothetical protein